MGERRPNRNATRERRLSMRRFVCTWLKRAALAGVAALVLVSLFLAVTPQGRATAKTAGLVMQVVPSFPIKPLSWFTADPVRTPITYAVSDRIAQADVYRIPDDAPRAAVVLFLGVNPAGRDDDRIVNLGNALAQAGFVVLVPWSESMASKRVDPADIDLLVGAFEYLKSRDYVDAERIGGGGFCVGSSMLLIAATDPRVRDDVAFVNFFSGYFDARDFLRQFSAQQSYYAGRREPWESDSLTGEVFTRLIIGALPNEQDRATLTTHLIDGQPRDDEALARLTSEAGAAYRLLSGATLNESDALIDQLPSDVLATMDALSPINYIDDVRARLLIMHDREDALAPVEESRRLRDAVVNRNDTRYTEFSFFSHVDPGERAGALALVAESFKLFRHLYSVVRTAS
jgi:hypothetical protein